MSRIGKKIIAIPSNTSVTINGAEVSIKGPLGELKRTFPTTLEVITEGATLKVMPRRSAEVMSAIWGTASSHLSNMIKGVHTPYEKKLIIEGIGFKADIKGETMTLALGFSHPVILKIPAGLKVLSEKGNVTITGIDKEAVGQFASKIRALKKPEPYKGKGIRYADEVIRRKQGKKTT